MPVRWQETAALPEDEAWGGGFEEYPAIPERARRVGAQVRASGHETIVAVTHEWFTQHLIRATMGLPEGEEAADRGWFSAPNASVTEIELEDGAAVLTRLGDVAHLGELVSRSPRRVV